MSGINNISGSPTTPIQHSPSPVSEPARLVIRTVDQARDHWRAVTTLTQAEEAIGALDDQMEEGHIDEETYRQLAGALMDIYNALMRRGPFAQPGAPPLPVHNGQVIPIQPGAQRLALRNGQVIPIQPGAQRLALRNGQVIPIQPGAQRLALRNGQVIPIQPGAQQLALRPLMPHLQAPAPAQGGRLAVATDAQIMEHLRNPDGSLRTLLAVQAALQSVGSRASSARIFAHIRQAR